MVPAGFIMDTNKQQPVQEIEHEVMDTNSDKWLSETTTPVEVASGGWILHWFNQKKKMRIKSAELRAIKSKYLRLLYPSLKDSARQELEWIKNELPPSRSLYRACWLRGRHYPLQYILGSQPFGELSIQCRPRVLIPRWETEEWAMQLAPYVKGIKGLDLCTGTGCIAFALEHAGMKASAVDLSPHAQKVFAINKRALNSRAEFYLQDISQPLGLQADLVTINPPYVVSPNSLDRSVRVFEPQLALMGDKPILGACVERCIEASSRAAVIEIGLQEQIEFLVSLFKKHGWSAEGRLDGAGNPRTVWAHRGDSFL